MLVERSGNGAASACLVRGRQRLTGRSVSRLACLRVERYITLDSGGGQGLAASRSQGECILCCYEELAADATASIGARNAGNIPHCHGFEDGEDQFRQRGCGTESVQAV